MPKSKKRSTTKRTSRADRSKILAEMNATGMTAKAAAKKYGLSPWTIYGWRSGKGGMAAKKSPARATGSLGETLRPLIADLVRQELARLLTPSK